jgi:hypothetical protein
VFEVPCPECGAAVEFFKDEPGGRCSKCDHRFRNPGVDFGCAQWCSLAEQCLGLVPDLEPKGGSGEGALAGRLIQEVRQACQGDSDRLTHSLKVYHFAKEFVAKEGGDPRVVLAAALLLAFGEPEKEPQRDDRAASVARHSKAKSVLRQIGVDEDTVQKVCAIVDTRPSREDSVESRVVRDADRLARLTASDPGADPRRVEEFVANQLQTAAAKDRARRLFQLAPEADG